MPTELYQRSQLSSEERDRANLARRINATQWLREKCRLFQNDILHAAERLGKQDALEAVRLFFLGSGDKTGTKKANQFQSSIVDSVCGPKPAKGQEVDDELMEGDE